MSAWLCSETHISAIVNAVDGSAKDFKTLVAENIRSLEARYPGRDFLGEWKREARKFQLQPKTEISATQIIKFCDCFDYQACETDDYHGSKAAAFVGKVRAYARTQGGKDDGAEYNAATWGD